MKIFSMYFWGGDRESILKMSQLIKVISDYWKMWNMKKINIPPNLIIREKSRKEEFHYSLFSMHATQLFSFFN